MIGIIYLASCHSEDLSTQCCCRQNTHTCTQRQKLPRYNATNILNSSWRLSQTTTFKPPKKKRWVFLYLSSVTVKAENIFLPVNQTEVKSLLHYLKPEPKI